MIKILIVFFIAAVFIYFFIVSDKGGAMGEWSQRFIFLTETFDNWENDKPSWQIFLLMYEFHWDEKRGEEKVVTLRFFNGLL